jgi:hypothetical protein
MPNKNPNLSQLIEEHKHTENISSQRTILTIIALLCFVTVVFAGVWVMHDILLAPVNIQADCTGTGINLQSQYNLDDIHQNSPNNRNQAIYLARDIIQHASVDNTLHLNNTTIHCNLQLSAPLLTIGKLR